MTTPFPAASLCRLLGAPEPAAALGASAHTADAASAVTSGLRYAF